MKQDNRNTGAQDSGDGNAEPKDQGHDYSADYESEYTVPALAKQNQRIESGLMSPHDIPESMPVLRAFHEFLDQERKRTQRRMMILAGVCIGVVVMVILCGILLVLNYGANARYRNAIVDRDLADARDDASKAKAVAESSLNKYTDKTDKLKDMILNGQQQLTVVQTRAAATAEQQQRDIDALRRQIELLQSSRPVVSTGSAESDAFRKRQDDLIRELEKTRAELVLAKASAERSAQIVPDRTPTTPPRRVESVHPTTTPVAVATVDTPPTVSITTTSGATSVQMSLVPRGADRPIAWRLPVPSR